MGVVVSDPDSSLDFYLKGIGLVEGKSFTISGKALRPISERLKEKKVPFLGSPPTPLNQESHFVPVQDPDRTFVELIRSMA
ncbi:hypothetical protein GCM10007389_39610 [Pontibacter akesuensis]|nr:hypothetical protein GCM10007389_39610 [Pontibacter akesuensis]